MFLPRGGVHVVSACGSIHAKHFGKGESTGSSATCATVPPCSAGFGSPFTSSFTLIAANGDTALQTVEIRACLSGSLTVHETGTYTFTGGTWPFLGCCGQRDVHR